MSPESQDEVVLRIPEGVALLILEAASGVTYDEVRVAQTVLQEWVDKALARRAEGKDMIGLVIPHGWQARWMTPDDPPPPPPLPPEVTA